MKSFCRKAVPFTVIILAFLISLAISGCNSGVSKEERLSKFKSDILADSNTRDNFKGHPNAGSGIDSDTFDLTTLIAGGPVVFTGQDIGGSTFTLYYTNAGTPHSASGTFYYDDSDVLGASWFIYEITVDGTSYPLP